MSNIGHVETGVARGSPVGFLWEARFVSLEVVVEVEAGDTMVGLLSFPPPQSPTHHSYTPISLSMHSMDSD